MRGAWRILLSLVWLAALLCVQQAPAQTIMERLITPGPLSSDHAKLESRCDSCHSSFRKEAQNGKCIACHKDVGADIRSGRGFHGKFTPARSGACKGCHSEHHGTGFALVKLDRAAFNHALTNFVLTGGHVRVTCSACHTPGKKFRLAPQECAACHGAKDPHKGQLGRACQSCHTTAAWKPIQPFDHSRTGFELTGAHRQATCMSCHAGQRWKGLGTTCVSCHAKDDAHKGSRGTTCASCHATTNWKAVTFDHASTGFPLVGGHAAAACTGCHGPGNTNKHPSRTCFACHAKDDTHKGGNGQDCGRCHSERAWKIASFDHSRMTGFPLTGAHAKAKCAACHTRPPAELKLSSQCGSCHAAKDVHNGNLGQSCGRCHDSTDWKAKVRFDHDLSRFPLLGKHAQLQCVSCHADKTFAAKGLACADCHNDKHHKGTLGTPAQCRNCHNSNDWKAWSFDHDRQTDFALTGQHKGLICSACHVRAGDPGKLSTQCVSCHRRNDIHRGGFGEDCGRCHTTASFTDITIPERR